VGRAGKGVGTAARFTQTDYHELVEGLSFSFESRKEEQSFDRLRTFGVGMSMMAMTRWFAISTALVGLASPLAAQTPQGTPALAPSEIVAAAPLSDWIAIAPADLLVMDLAPDARGRTRRVVIQLMPAPFSQGWIGNIRTLAAVRWWDGTSINRVQDNYVVQWGDASEAKPLPEGLARVPQLEYRVDPGFNSVGLREQLGVVQLPEDMSSRDQFAPLVAFWKGWPIGIEYLAYDVGTLRGWPVHCYGMVGVGRNLAPDTGSGAELYTVIGHAPRHLDRNIALVGRVIEGIEHLSSLPRGTEALGFYATAEERVPIVSVRIATDLPAAEQPRFHYLSTESETFARYADARANRRDPFFNVPAGGADICNIPVPVRRVAAP
jgi:cyclophilin family peptidyl-prolyl cis-trans isomerase